MLCFLPAVFGGKGSKAVHANIWEGWRRVHMLPGQVRHPLCLKWPANLSAGGTFVYVLGDDRAASTDPVSIWMDFVSIMHLPWCFVFLWKWSIIRLVMWPLLGSTVGCFSLMCIDAFSSLPPTRSTYRPVRRGLAGVVCLSWARRCLWQDIFVCWEMFAFCKPLIMRHSALLSSATASWPFVLLWRARQTIPATAQMACFMWRSETVCHSSQRY